MYNQDWNQYIYDLNQHLERQDNRIKALEEQIQHLLSSDKGNVIIEKIEYKFDQLKVETLSGSLHIGLSPEDLSQIDDVALGQIYEQNKIQNLPLFEHQLTSELQHWLQQSGPSMIQDLATNHERTIDPSHQALLLQDIQKQFPNRIAFYKDEAIKTKQYPSEAELHEYIAKQIKGEVQHSLANYMKNNKGELKHDDGSS